jgi:hypothetical protein
MNIQGAREGYGPVATQLARVDLAGRLGELDQLVLPREDRILDVLRHLAADHRTKRRPQLLLPCAEVILDAAKGYSPFTLLQSRNSRH